MVTLSYIMPVYNGSKFLERAINSILSQPCDDYELIIINDGSKDNSMEIIKKCCYGKDNVTIIDISNSGVGHARNLGIEKAKGKYLLFIDQDDLIFKNKYNSELVEKLSDAYNRNVDALAFRCIKSDENITRFTSESSTMHTVKQSDGSIKTYMASSLPTHFVFYKTDIIKKNNLKFFEQFKLIQICNLLTPFFTIRIKSR